MAHVEGTDADAERAGVRGSRVPGSDRDSREGERESDQNGPSDSHDDLLISTSHSLQTVCQRGQRRVPLNKALTNRQLCAMVRPLGRKLRLSEIEQLWENDQQFPGPVRLAGGCIIVLNEVPR